MRFRVLVLAVLAALVAVGGAAVPAAAAGATTLTGRVEYEGRGVAGATVRFEHPNGTAIFETTTRADGTFSLRVTATWEGYLAVGNHILDAVWSAGGRAYVPAVIGATRPDGVPSAVRTGVVPTTAARLGAGGPLTIPIGLAGQVTGVSSQLAVAERIPDGTNRPGSTIVERGVVRVLHEDGTVVDAYDAPQVPSLAPDGSEGVVAGADGRFTTFALVPGRYSLQYVPRGSVVGTTVPVTVRAGVTPVTVPRFAPAPSVSGTVTNDGRPIRGIRVELRQGARLVTRVGTDARGGYRFPGLSPGDYVVRVLGSSDGVNIPRDPVDRDAMLTTLPYGPVTVPFAVTAGAADLVRDLAVPTAAVVEGRVPAGRIVVLEDESGTRLRSDVASGLARTVRFGGLAPGRYRLVEGAVGRTTTGPLAGATTVQRYGVRELVLRAGRHAALPDLAMTRSAITLSGTTARVGGGRVVVRLGDDPLGAVLGAVDNGRYTVPGLLPGRWTLYHPATGGTALLPVGAGTVRHDLPVPPPSPTPSASAGPR